MGLLKFRFYTDSDTEQPHIYNHDVNEEEEEVVEHILLHSREDRRGHDGSRIAMGQTSDGRYLKIIYVPDPIPNSVFVITAYDLTGKPLTAYKRRLKRKGKK